MEKLSESENLHLYRNIHFRAFVPSIGPSETYVNVLESSHGHPGNSLNSRMYALNSSGCSKPAFETRWVSCWVTNAPRQLNHIHALTFFPGFYSEIGRPQQRTRIQPNQQTVLTGVHKWVSNLPQLWTMLPSPLFLIPRALFLIPGVRKPIKLNFNLVYPPKDFFALVSRWDKSNLIQHRTNTPIIDPNFNLVYWPNSSILQSSLSPKQTSLWYQSWFASRKCEMVLHQVILN